MTVHAGELSGGSIWVSSWRDRVSRHQEGLKGAREERPAQPQWGLDYRELGRLRATQC